MNLITSYNSMTCCVLFLLYDSGFSNTNKFYLLKNDMPYIIPVSDGLGEKQST